MLLHGITPPEVGSIRDRVLTRMYSMEQAEKFELVTTVGSLVVASSKPDQTTVKNSERIVEAYRESLAFGNWSNEKRKETQRKQFSDIDMIERLKRLSKKA